MPATVPAGVCAATAAAERDAALAAVPEDVRARYERIAHLRGTGVAEAKDGVCQTCHVKLRVQVWAEVRKNESVVECDSCSRILYYEPPPPVVEISVPVLMSEWLVRTSTPPGPQTGGGTSTTVICAFARHTCFMTGLRQTGTPASRAASPCRKS